MTGREEPPPWRVLDQPSTSATASTPAPPPRATERGRGPSEGRERWLLGLATAIALLLAAGSFLLAGTNEPAVRIETMAAASGAPPPTSEEIIVDIGGAVRRPGIVRLPAGSRVADAIAAAGGFGPRVDTERVARQLNLAARLADGDHIQVPSRDDPTTEAGTVVGGGSDPVAKTRLDLNRATAAELEALPGIGPVTAAKIVAAREEARFTSVDELRTRKLVGAATFEKIRDLVTVR